ncbi:hypothetical protein IMSHALPRED_009325 [Imshaugia aleurites]|uniref:Uncharacterized protein n=1 Tax=Imshaugia aleurites TaxID=172621 RepID=A0A8H3FYI7_9LECA|nr:hypothetical protein IMSHALPRED_009325 [Imshaugia aleurites]
MLDSSAKEPHLSTSEQISPQAYVRFVLCLGITPDAGHDEITQILRQGLKATATKVLVLNSLIVSVTESNGRQTKGAPRGDIQSQGFPNQIFDGEMLRPTGVFAVPGSPVAVFLTQANLVTGGLLLGMSVWHGAIDGTAILNYRNCGHRIAAPYKIQTDKILGPSPYLPMLSMHRVYRRSLALKEEE